MIKVSPKKESFYIRLQSKLEKSMVFPEDYLFKFIMKTDAEKEKQLLEIFKWYRPQVNISHSSGKKYSSYSIRIEAVSSDQIISIYKDATQIEGIVSL